MKLLGNMRSGVVVSISGHLLLVFFAQFGLPHLFTPPPVSIEIIPVELVTIDDTNAPPPPATPEPEPEPEPEAAAPPPPKPRPEPPAPPAPPEPEVVEAPPPPPPDKPKPPEKKPEPEPQPTELAKAQPQSKPKPPKPPKPPKDFASVLKDLAQLETTPAPPKRDPDKAEQEDKPSPTPQVEQQASITEIERLKQMIRQQIQPCWSPPVGAAGAEDLAITIFIRVDQRGFVREAKVVDAPAMAFSTYVQAAADAARRAVLNPRCQPFQLPQNRYDLWKEIRFNFDPRDMLG